MKRIKDYISVATVQTYEPYNTTTKTIKASRK